MPMFLFAIVAMVSLQRVDKSASYTSPLYEDSIGGIASWNSWLHVSQSFWMCVLVAYSSLQQS
jgi:hypothetical protein